jgi:hypothetical protein
MTLKNSPSQRPERQEGPSSWVWWMLGVFVGLGTCGLDHRHDPRPDCLGQLGPGGHDGSVVASIRLPTGSGSRIGPGTARRRAGPIKRLRSRDACPPEPRDPSRPGVPVAAPTATLATIRAGSKPHRFDSGCVCSPAPIRHAGEGWMHSLRGNRGCLKMPTQMLIKVKVPSDGAKKVP